MELKDALVKRYSCRNYLPLKLDKTLLEEIVQRAQNAPSAVNKQPYKVLVLNSDENLKKVGQIYPRDWIKQVPQVLLVCAILNEGWVRSDGVNHAIIDTALFIDQLTLTATDLGLATCWVCNFEFELSKRVFTLPGNYEPVALIPMGYPALSEVQVKKRKTLREILEYNTFK